jgi:hypothetical protein
MTAYVDEIIEDHQLTDILHLSDTGEETGLQWNSTSAIYRLKANL